MYSCVATQMYEQMIKQNLIKAMEQVSITSFNTPPLETSTTSKDSSINSYSSKKILDLKFSPESKDTSTDSNNFPTTTPVKRKRRPRSSNSYSYASDKIRDSLWNAFLISSKQVA